VAIHVLEDYRGRQTQERVIKAGMYEADDPALFGAAAYLVANGVAVETDSAPEPSPLPDKSELPDKADPLITRTVEQLTALADAHGVDLTNASRKSDIIAAIRAADVVT